MPLNRFKFQAKGVPQWLPLANTGPVIQVRIQLPHALERSLIAGKSQVPDPISGFAIVDTGATNCAVNEMSIQNLGVNPIGTVHTGSSAGFVQSNVYPGRLTLLLESGELTLSHSRLVGVNLNGYRMPGLDQPLLALLGRDFLSRFVLHYDGPGGEWALYN